MKSPLRLLLTRHLALVLLFACVSARSQQVPGGFSNLQTAYSNQVAVIQKESGTEREKIQTQVGRELKSMEDKLAARGDLPALVQCQKAQKLVTEGWLEWGLETPAPEMATLQKNVLQAQARLDEARRRRLDTLRKQYLSQLDQLKLTLTRQKKVEEALRVQQECELVKTELGASAADPANRPPPPVVRPTVRPPAPGSRKVLFSFEEEKDLKSWETRSGSPVARVELHATDGRFALAAHAGNLLVSTDFSNDWRGFKALEIDFHLEGAKSLPVEITIGDQAWIDKQTYWNRHNRFEEIKGGSSTLTIPTQNLYRGEKGSKNKDLSKDLDLESIRYLALHLGEPSAAVVYIDHIRLVK